MSSSNEGDGMLRRMVRMVSSPARDLMGRSTDSSPSQFADAEKAELKAMIERKRRNDFVRKRELNMLRQIRREGLTPEQAAALEATSRLDDSEVRQTQSPGALDRGVKAKIDAIEQQMVGSLPASTRPSSLGGLSRPAAVPGRPIPAPRMGQQSGLMSVDTAASMPARPTQDAPAPRTIQGTLPMAFTPAAPAWNERPPLASHASLPILTDPMPVGRPEPLPETPRPTSQVPLPLPSMEVSEAVHDHELDEAVIAFANADFNHCERALVALVAPQGNRAGHEDTWLALFDLYRAIGQPARFETLAQAYFQRFQKSAPQWYSLPRLVADATSSGTARAPGQGDVGWVCPPQLDADAVSGLVSQTLQLPQPWVLDWTALRRVEPDAANSLHRLFSQWAVQPHEMRWLGSDRLFAVLQDSAPVGVRDADPGYWQARLEALRLINRPDQFDEVAIDFCVTYEVSPPSWEATRCVTRVAGSALNTRSATLSVIGDVVTTLQAGGADTQGVAITTLDLSGQLSGDIVPVLAALEAKLGGAQVVRISCALLIRVDFIAAGDLLNWVIARRGEGRHISFVEVHRLVALMFGAMGISDHAPVHLRHS